MKVDTIRAAQADLAAAPEEGDDVPAKDRQFVTALARGLSVLRAFTSSNEVLGNQEIARRTGLPKPTISRLTHTLLELNYLRIVKDRDKYQLGPAVLALGMSFFRSNSFAQIARPFLQELANATQAHVALGIREGLNSVYMQLWRGRGQSITISREIGFHLPLAKSAMGLAMVAALDEDERPGVITALQAQVGDDWPRLEAELARGPPRDRADRLLHRARRLEPGYQCRGRAADRAGNEHPLCREHLRPRLHPHRGSTAQ